MKKTSFSKNLKRAILAAVMATGALFVSAGSASAQTVGVQFGYGTATYAGTGVLGESFLMFGSPGTVTPTGTPASGQVGASESLGGGVTLTFTSGGPGYNANDGGGGGGGAGGGSSSNFFSNFTVQNPGTGATNTYTLTGLTAGGLYNVAVYGGDLGNRSGDSVVDFSINGGTAVAVGTANGGGSFVPQSGSGGNYTVFDNVAASGGTITVAATGTGNYTEFSGIGIEAVPEPSTWALMFAGVAALVGVNLVRRRNAS